MFARPVTPCEVVVIELESNTVVVKLELVDTCNRYDVAPLAVFQFNVGLVEMPVAPFCGDDSVGAGGGLTTVIVVKLHTDEYALVPAAFVALTRQ